MEFHRTEKPLLILIRLDLINLESFLVNYIQVLYKAFKGYWRCTHIQEILHCFIFCFSFRIDLEAVFPILTERVQRWKIKWDSFPRLVMNYIQLLWVVILEWLDIRRHIRLILISRGSIFFSLSQLPSLFILVRLRPKHGGLLRK